MARKPVVTFIALFFYFLLQVIFFKSYLGDATVGSYHNSNYLLAIDVLLLFGVTVMLVLYWNYQLATTRYMELCHSFIFSLTMGWVILAGPYASQIGFYYAGNLIIAISILGYDVCYHGYDTMRRLSARMPGLSSSSRLSNSRSKFEILDDKEEYAGSGNLSSQLHGGMAISEDENSNSSGSGRGGGGRIVGVNGATDVEQNMAINSDIGASRDDDLYWMDYSQLKESEKLVFEGFRLQIESLPLPVIYRDVEVSNSNSNHLGLANINSASGLYNSNSNSNTSQVITTRKRVVVPDNLEWSHFTNIQHCIDSSSCHIHTAMWGSKPVILKLIKAERVSSVVAMAEFTTEESVLRRVQHDHVVKFLGSGSVPRRFLVLERLVGGSLAHILGVRPDNALFKGILPSRKFTMLETLRVGLAIAKAVDYLHSSFHPTIHVLHRDLKPDNIGVLEDGTVKLFDFGLCAVVRRQRVSTEQYKLTGNTGTMRYMAPEVLLGRAYHQSVDAYSFGVVMWQIASGQVPYKHMGKKSYFDRIVIGGERLKLSRKWPAGFRTLLAQCWSEDKNARPDFSHIVSELTTLLIACEKSLEAKKNSLSTRAVNYCTQKMQTRKAKCVLFLAAVLILIFAAIIVSECTGISSCEGGQPAGILAAVLLMSLSGGFMLHAVLLSFFNAWPCKHTQAWLFDTIPSPLDTGGIPVGGEAMVRSSSSGGSTGTSSGGGGGGSSGMGDPSSATKLLHFHSPQNNASDFDTPVSPSGSSAADTNDDNSTEITEQRRPSLLMKALHPMTATTTRRSSLTSGGGIRRQSSSSAREERTSSFEMSSVGNTSNTQTTTVNPLLQQQHTQ